MPAIWLCAFFGHAWPEFEVLADFPDTTLKRQPPCRRCGMALYESWAFAFPRLIREG